MFENIPQGENKAGGQPQLAREAEDIFSETDKPGAVPPSAANDLSLAGESAVAETADRKYIIIGAAVLGVALLAGAGAFVYKSFVASQPAEPPAEVSQEPPAVPEEKAPAETSPAEKQPVALPETNVGNNAAKPVLDNAASGTAENITSNHGGNNQASSTGAEEAVPPADDLPIDSDQDGLSDEEEKALGTDPNNIDTDGDGLFDREEAKVYKTDPLKADTDGDGYADGAEVKGGYNPNGPGKLYEIK